MRDVYRYDAWFTRVSPRASSKFTSRYIFFYFNSSNEKNPKKEEGSIVYNYTFLKIKKEKNNYNIRLYTQKEREEPITMIQTKLSAQGGIKVQPPRNLNSASKRTKCSKKKRKKNIKIR